MHRTVYLKGNYLNTNLVDDEVHLGRFSTDIGKAPVLKYVLLLTVMKSSLRKWSPQILFLSILRFSSKIIKIFFHFSFNLGSWGNLKYNIALKIVIYRTKIIGLKHCKTGSVTSMCYFCLLTYGMLKKCSCICF